MKLQYLGTAAAEAVPAPFCQCPVCEDARRKGGRNIRTRSQAMVDSRLLLDFPADTYLHTLRENLRLYEVNACLITHCHSDHIYPAELECLISWAAHRNEPRTFHLYGTAPVLRMIREQFSGFRQVEQEGDLALHEITAFQPFTADGYRVTALKADHGAEDSIVYLIEKDGKSMLYAHDTGLLPGESMDYLRTLGQKLDLISYDCTNGLLDSNNRNHMGLEGDAILRERLRELGVVTEKTVHVVNHFSHNGAGGYDEMFPAAREKGFLTSYDGMTVEF